MYMQFSTFYEVYTRHSSSHIMTFPNANAPLQHLRHPLGLIDYLSLIDTSLQSYSYTHNLSTYHSIHYTLPMTHYLLETDMNAANSDGIFCEWKMLRHRPILLGRLKKVAAGLFRSGRHRTSR